MDHILADINWETVLVASIVPIIGLIGLIYQSYQKRKETRDSNNAQTANRREPTWVELDEANRKLRQEMEENERRADERFKKLEERFDTFVKKTNTRIGALSNMLHTAQTSWPEGVPGPYFSREDLDALENTDVPFVWRNRVRPYQ